MKVTYSWLKDFVEIKLSPKKLAEKLTMAGLEVTSLEERQQDYVFEIEVTANRPDCLSVIGIAREIAAIQNSKFKILPPDIQKARAGSRQNTKSLSGKKSKEEKELKILIEDKKDCPLYTAKIIKDVKVGPSPDWLRRRLELVGYRSVNNIVDITNYILFTFGEPLHAFDLDKLSGNKILVRRAKNNERIITIDGQQRTLNPDILVIADEKNPVALAGIMGGRDTEVSESSKHILLEAAVFNPVTIRRARQALGLVSESAYRFERGVDLEIVEYASRQTVKLIQELAGGNLVLAKSSVKPKAKSKSIKLDALTVNKILGVNIPAAGIKKILDGLGLEAKIKTAKNLIVNIPSHRQDLNLEIDLIEEIARIFGYENIPKSSPPVRPQVSVEKTKDLVSLVKNILVGLGLNEVITYSLIDKDLLGSLCLQQEPIEILNPLSKEQEILRPTILPSLGACIAYNLNQKQEYINIFEVATAFLNLGAVKEELVLGIALSGMKSLFLKQGVVKDEVGFLDLKGILESLFERLGIYDYSFDAPKNPFTVAVLIRQEKIGRMVRLEKHALDRLDIKNKDVFALEVSLEKVFSYARLQKTIASLPRYPGITRDISFIIKDEVSVKNILLVLQEKAGSLLSNIRVADYYKGKQIPPGYRGITLSCVYRSDERTLTEGEVNPLHTEILRILTEEFGASIR
jgi:phenylalanyl-tRNA synthetase beta chain